MTTITKEDRLYISQIAQDHETGHHLLLPRCKEYHKRYEELSIAFMQLDYGILMPRSIDILECYYSMFYSN